MKRCFASAQKAVRAIIQKVDWCLSCWFTIALAKVDGEITRIGRLVSDTWRLPCTSWCDWDTATLYVKTYYLCLWTHVSANGE